MALQGSEEDVMDKLVKLIVVAAIVVAVIALCIIFPKLRKKVWSWIKGQPKKVRKAAKAAREAYKQ